MQKVSEALSIYSRNFVLLSLLVLTVRFPINLLVEIIANNLHQRDGLEQLVNYLMSAIFDPIYIGAITYSLWQIKREGTLTYANAMLNGYKNWGKIFAIQVLSGFIILLGLIALIVPGFIFSVRYSLVIAIVIVEGYGNGSKILKRSAALTKGKQWQIFISTCLALLLFIIVSFAVGLVSIFVVGLVSNFVETDIIVSLTGVIFSCLIDLVAVIFPVIFFLYYWQARQEEVL